MIVVAMVVAVIVAIAISADLRLFSGKEFG